MACMHTEQLSGSLVQLAECSNIKHEALGSSPSWVTIFPSLLHLVAQYGFVDRATSIKKCTSHCSSLVLSRFWDKSYIAGEKCQRMTEWVVSSVGRVLAR